MSHAEGVSKVRTKAVFWFSVVVFARLYTAVLCDFLGRIVGLDFICYTWFNNIPSYLWVEIIFYGPVIWLALHQVNTDVFGDVPTEPEALKKHRRLQFISTAAIAIILYGVGVHVTDTLEVLSREREGITDGSVYDLIYFLDEGLSHYIQFFPLFFVMGWFLIFDREGRTGNAYLALFLGVTHGVERAVGIIEGEKWFLGPAVMTWMATAAWIRWRRVGSAAFKEFFFRHAMAFLLILPVCQVVYYLWFDAFPPPSSLSDGELAQMAAGAIALTAVGTVVVIALDRWWHNRRAGSLPGESASVPPAAAE